MPLCQLCTTGAPPLHSHTRTTPCRFLCRIKEEELLEPLVPSILANLDHRHSYVRRNAVLAINAIYKLPKGELLLQDAPETIEKMLRQEQVRRGAGWLGLVERMLLMHVHSFSPCEMPHAMLRTAACGLHVFAPGAVVHAHTA